MNENEIKILKQMKRHLVFCWQSFFISRDDCFKIYITLFIIMDLHK